MGKLILAGVVLGLIIMYIINKKNDSALAVENIQIGKVFLKENINKHNVISTPSGLQY